MNSKGSKAKEKGELLREWTEGVKHPGVSGFELLELMDIRSKLAQEELEGSLTPKERRALEEADGLFLRNAREFYEQIARVADLRGDEEGSRGLPFPLVVSGEALPGGEGLLI